MIKLGLGYFENAEIEVRAEEPSTTVPSLQDDLKKKCFLDVRIRLHVRREPLGSPCPFYSCPVAPPACLIGPGPSGSTHV